MNLDRLKMYNTSWTKQNKNYCTTKISNLQLQ